MAKKDEADLRREVYEAMAPAERDARHLLTRINALRHGRLEHIADLGDMAGVAKQLSKTLKDYAHSVGSPEEEGS